MSDHPLARAELTAEFDEPLGGILGRVHGDGWTVRDMAGNVLLDRDLRVRRRFPIPGHFRASGEFDWGVHPGGRWAVFAGVRRTECIGVDGEVVWALDRPVRLSVDGDPQETCAVFPPEGDGLWVFVPVADDDWDKEDAGAETERWRVSLPGLTVTRTGPVEGRGRHVLFHQDGRHIGSSDCDGHSVDGYWWRWRDDGAALAASGVGHPIDVHPDGKVWLGDEFGTLCLNSFETSAEGKEEEEEEEEEGDDDEEDEEDEDVYSADRFDEAFLLNRDLVLASARDGDSHRALSADTLASLARVAHPDAFAEERWLGLAAAGDGTWTTTSRRPDTPGARLRHRRLSPKDLGSLAG